MEESHVQEPLQQCDKVVRDCDAVGVCELSVLLGSFLDV